MLCCCREVVDAYSTGVYMLCNRLLETLSTTLGLEPHVLGERVNAKALGVRTSCNYYPPCPQPELVLGLIPHADSSIFTLLQQDGQVSGLEILKDGQWYQVPPLKDAFVVNVGDQLQVTVTSSQNISLLEIDNMEINVMLNIFTMV